MDSPIFGHQVYMVDLPLLLVLNVFTFNLDFSLLLAAENEQVEVHVGLEGRDSSLAVHDLQVLT